MGVKYFQCELIKANSRKNKNFVDKGAALNVITRDKVMHADLGSGTSRYYVINFTGGGGGMGEGPSVDNA